MAISVMLLGRLQTTGIFLSIGKKHQVEIFYTCFRGISPPSPDNVTLHTPQLKGRAPSNTMYMLTSIRPIIILNYMRKSYTTFLAVRSIKHPTIIL